MAEDDASPLWEYVTILGRSGKTGGNCKWNCNICHKEWGGSHFRVKAHLMGLKGRGIRICASVTVQQKIEMQKKLEAFEKRVDEKKNKKEVSFPCASMGSSMGGASMGSSMGGASMGSSFLMQPTLLQRLGDQMQMQSRKRKSNKNNPIENAYNLALSEELDSEIARWWFSGGMCFTQARNPDSVRAFNFAASHDLSGYVPPGYNKLRTTLLQKEKVHERLLEPLKGTWKSKGVSIVCDGWSDAQRRPLINFIAINEGGPMFLKAINCQGEFKDKHYIAHLIEEVILEVGPMNVVQVITDNAPICKSAGLLIEARFPNVFWTPCVVHTLNLALRNICAARNTIRNEVTYAERSWIVDIIDGGWFLKSFICNHSMRLSIFNDHATMKMLSYAETRFASSIIMLQRLKDLKHGLQSMVVSTKWASYREDDVVKAAQERDLILNEVWWDKVEYILEFTKPIYDMLRLADTDEPCLHLMYEMWDSMIEKVKRIIFRHEGRGVDETSSFYDVVHKILVDRWEKSNTPLHCLTHSLNPRYYSTEWLQEVPGRVSPHLDLELSSERENAYTDIL